MIKCALFGIVWTFTVVQLALAAAPAAKTLFEWVKLDFTFPTQAARDQAIADKEFIVENCIITGVKQYKEDVFVTVPRWREGVPSSLNRVVPSTQLLEPYPSWEMNRAGNPSALQYIQSMEIVGNRMWIVDVGRRNIFSKDAANVVNGPPKLVIWDMDANVLVREFVFPSDVAPYASSFLNDIVVDNERGFAYISDASSSGAVVIYDFNANQARRWAGGPGMAVEPGVLITIAGKEYDFRTPTDGIALSPDAETLYYCPLLGYQLSSVPAALLRDFSTPIDTLNSKVTNHGKKDSQTDGMAFANNGLLYFGLLSGNGVNSWDPKQPMSTQTAAVQADEQTLQWVDTFAFDGKKGLLFTSNRLQLYFTDALDFTGSSGPNFRVLRLDIGANSYLEAQGPPTAPCVAGGGSGDGLAPGRVALAVALSAVAAAAVAAIVTRAAVKRSQGQSASGGTAYRPM